MDPATLVVLSDATRHNGIATTGVLSPNSMPGNLLEQGYNLVDLGQYLEALATFETACQQEPDNAEGWYGQGLALYRLERYTEAIAALNQALQLREPYSLALVRRGLTYQGLEQPEAARADFESVLAIDGESAEDWLARGIALDELGRYEEAIAAYDQALAIKADKHEAWYNRGISLDNLGRYEEAIAAYDQALHWTEGQDIQTWLNRGKVLLAWHWLERRDYHTAIENYAQGIRSLHPTQPDYAFGCGVLYRKKAEVLYQYAAFAPNPFPDWFEAKQSYWKAQEMLPLHQYPEQHLQIWQDLVRVCFALGDQRAVQQVLAEGAAKLARQLSDPELNLGSKIALERRFAGFDQLRVDALALQNPAAAWELAEASKNRALWRLRYGWGEQPPHLAYAAMQDFLPARTAIVYWHLSAAALTTFVLKAGHAPSVMAPSPSKRTVSQFPGQPAYPAALEQLQRFETCLQEWKRTYQSSDPEGEEPGTWRERLPSLLFTQLRGILDINRLVKDYLADVEQLILVPHRDLHLLPLHTLFPGRFTTTYLPSVQLGLELQQASTEPTDPQALLSVEDPPSAFVKAKAGSSGKMLFAELESAIIAKLYGARTIVGNDASRERVMHALGTGKGCFHFTGHAYHDLEHPLQSALALAGQDLLTLADLFQLNLSRYHLVCLSACETGLTSTADISDEYVGLVSGFLKAGVTQVVSTLWPVDEIASALFAIQFHQRLRHPTAPPPVLAFKQAQEWLKTVTWSELDGWYAELGQWYREQNGGVLDGNYETLQDAASNAKARGTEQGDDHPPYEHPYYWAGFIITGNL